MTLHCACRLGILDQLYQKRNEIAYALGLIVEVPIAMCSSDYDFDQSLKITTTDSSHSLPAHSIQTKEITLFFVTVYHYNVPQQVISPGGLAANQINLYDLDLVSSIFHPPAV